MVIRRMRIEDIQREHVGEEVQKGMLGTSSHRAMILNKGGSTKERKKGPLNCLGGWLCLAAFIKLGTKWFL